MTVDPIRRPNPGPILIGSAIFIAAVLIVGTALVRDSFRDGESLIAFSDSRGRFELDHPSSWSRPGDLGGVFQPNSEMEASLVILEIPFPDPKDYVVNSIMSELDQSPNGTVLEQGPIEIGGRPGYFAHIVDDNANGPGLVEAYAIAVSDGSGGSYSLTYVAPPDVFDAHFASAKAIMASFRVCERPPGCDGRAWFRLTHQPAQPACDSRSRLLAGVRRRER